MSATAYDLLIQAPPGLEHALYDETRAFGFKRPKKIQGGVICKGTWERIWQANIGLRSANKILVRVGSFHAAHLSELDKRAHRFHWDQFLLAGSAVKVEATCKRSKIYHAGAACERVAKALKDRLDITIDPKSDLRVLIRIEQDVVTISLDSSGAPLHFRGYKQEVGKGPLRETMAAGLLQACGFNGAEPILDPMCGSGTFPIEAALWASKTKPNTTRPFAFEQFITSDPDMIAELRQTTPQPTPFRFIGYDRDEGAIKNATNNAKRAGMAPYTDFKCQPISALTRPDGPSGLVIFNPPYGARIGNKNELYALYGTVGKLLKERFKGWRVGFITSDAGLAKATNLPIEPSQSPIAHGGLKIHLYQTKPLG